MVKDSEILKAARELIASHKEHRVCYAITAASERMRVPQDQEDGLLQWVTTMLGKYAYYESWLCGTHPIIAKRLKVHRIADFNQARPGRLAWLDWMIRQCEKREKAA